MEIHTFQDYRSKLWGFRIIHTGYRQVEFDEEDQLNLPSSPPCFKTEAAAMSAAKEAINKYK